MKIALAQINTITSDFEHNYRKILECGLDAKKLGADLIVFPELALCGCLPKDRVLSTLFIDSNSKYIKLIAKNISIPAIVGFVRKDKNKIYNSVAYINRNKINYTYDKMLLVDYGAWSDSRFFSKGISSPIIDVLGKKIALTICEDIWSESEDGKKRYNNHSKPLDIIAKSKVDLLINSSASLFSPENDARRDKLIKDVAKKINAPVLLCNLVGGNDELLFSGKSSFISKNGQPVKILKSFHEDLKICDTEVQDKLIPKKSDRIEELYNALILGLRDFIRKSNFKKVVVGLSGGIDSAFVATLATDAIGKENVMGISLPSKISSQHSKDDASQLAKNLGISFHTIKINDVVSSAEKNLEKIFNGMDPDITEENLQSRARGLLLMAISNKFGSMLLTTGNKSEAAVGYCTLYGDTCGGYAPIVDVFKTDVYKLCNYVNKDKIRIPLNTIQKPPSAELRPNQKDNDSLPDYNILDEILYLYLEKNFTAKKIISKGFDKNIVLDVLNKYESTEYKRKQVALGTRVSDSYLSNIQRTLTEKKIYEI